MARRNQDFQTIRSEGGLLPADLLRRVLNRRSNLVGTKPEDYGLPPGERLNEVITQSWNRLRKHWAEFRAAAENLAEGDAGTGLTNDRWSLPLLRELDFGLLPTSAGPEIEGRTYAVSRFFGPVPVHLIGCGLSLDRRAAGQRGAAAVNPHGLVQEFLNRSDAHLWALLGNGLRLRILRDNQALSRQSFLEFDLEAMFTGEVYSDFVLLWLVAHASRFAPRDGGRPESCWLEQWAKEAAEQGTRALGQLRISVERALAILGEGFTAHPKNAALRKGLRCGRLTPAKLHAELLRIIYRLIFLFVAEDRTLEGQPLIHPFDDSHAARVARARYTAHYSVTRLRDMAGKIKGSRHGDLWRQFQLIVRALSGDSSHSHVREQLKLPALGSFLWSPASTVELNDAEITNFDFLEAIRHLAFTRHNKFLRPVDYKNLGAEELGGVYESLLALTPQVSGDGARFSFAEFAGSERKTSGSYYTPDSLVQCLLNSALDPVIEEAVRGKNASQAEEALLSLKVCDPAVGSGHFLVGAAHRLARRLSRIRAMAAGESEPSPLLHQQALRDLIGRCLYGVDLNPMAAELCRVSLWLEALEPGRPLSFLDHHIRVGNSLLGATPELIATGLPDEAFEAITGDDSQFCAELKRRNRQERDGGQMGLGLALVAESRGEYDTLASRSQGIDEAPDDTLDAIELKAEQFRRLVVSPEYRHQQLVADAWCAAFVCRKTDGASEAITTDVIRRLEVDADALDTFQRDQMDELTNRYQFFHWHLAFPEVSSQGGFDCILGNPPWEVLELDTSRWFKGRNDRIAGAKNASERKAMIDALLQSAEFEPDKKLANDYLEQLRLLESQQTLIRGSSRYPLTATGKLNVFGPFLELSWNLVSGLGAAGLLVPDRFLVGETYSSAVSYLLQSERLVSAFTFENEAKLFREITNKVTFAAVTIGGKQRTEKLPRFTGHIQAPEQIGDPTVTYALSAADIDRINPSSHTVPLFRDSRDAFLTKRIHLACPVLRSKSATQKSDWDAQLTSMYNMSSDSGKFIPSGSLGESCARTGSGWIRTPDDRLYVPLYEGKMARHFNYRSGTYEGQITAQANKGVLPEMSVEHLKDPDHEVLTRYVVPAGEFEQALSHLSWEKPWFLGFRDVGPKQRTLVPCVVPQWASAHSFTLLLSKAPIDEQLGLVAALSSYICDYAVRQKSRRMSIFVVEQAPVPTPQQLRSTKWANESVLSFVAPRVLELIATSRSLGDFAIDCGWDGPPFRWDESRRFTLECEMNAALFHAYLASDRDGSWSPLGVSLGNTGDDSAEELSQLTSRFACPRDAVGYVLDTFTIVRRNDEELYGEYRTKQAILEIYDAMQAAICTGDAYETQLDPLPGPPLDIDGNFVGYADIADNPPTHIHLPTGAVAGGNVLFHLSDLIACFPDTPFRLHLDTGSGARELRVNPVQTAEIEATDTVVLASPNLKHKGVLIATAVGRLRVESRIDPNDGSRFVLVSVRGDDGLAQARFTEDEWQALTTIGVVDHSAKAAAADG